jgi:hypothetical protein
MRKVILIIISIASTLSCFLAPNFALAKINKKSQSISIQVGVNGVNSDRKSYGLQFFPPDIAYSHEMFDNNIVNISGGVFYDNIGVKIKDRNFSYRVGSRIDFGLELGRYTPYITSGLATIRNAHNYQSSAIFGTGILTRINRDFMLTNEINFQNVHYKNSSYTIVNLSVGVNYLF